MQLAEKGDLRRYIRENFANFTFQDRISYLSLIITDLITLHDDPEGGGTVHRDIHSGNILLGSNGVYLSDLGRARHLDQISENEPVIGIMGYVAPEIIQCQKYTKAADIYSIGMIVWEMVTGEVPFASETPDFRLSIKIIEGDRPDIPDYLPPLWRHMV